MNTEFRTTDIILAATLRELGYKLEGITRNGNSFKGIFIFNSIPEEVIKDFDLGETRVEPVSFNNTIKHLTNSVKRLN